MEKDFQITGRIRELSSEELHLNFMVDNDQGITAEINLCMDKDKKYDALKSEAFNLFVLYENLLTKAKPDTVVKVNFAYDRSYNAEEPWLRQRHYFDDVHHVAQYRFSGMVKNVNVEVTISGQSTFTKNIIDGLLGSLRIKNLTLYNDSNGGDVLSFEEE